MSEKIYMMSECERCSHTEKQEIKPFLKFLLRKPNRPKGWQIINETELCPTCVTEHNQEYKEMWLNFMSQGDKIKKQ